MITADTITAGQIEALRERASAEGDAATVAECTTALLPQPSQRRWRARRYCATKIG